MGMQELVNYWDTDLNHTVTVAHVYEYVNQNHSTIFQSTSTVSLNSDDANSVATTAVFFNDLQGITTITSPTPFTLLFLQQMSTSDSCSVSARASNSDGWEQTGVYLPGDGESSLYLASNSTNGSEFDPSIGQGISEAGTPLLVPDAFFARFPGLAHCRGNVYGGGGVVQSLTLAYQLTVSSVISVLENEGCDAAAATSIAEAAASDGPDAVNSALLGC